MEDTTHATVYNLLQLISSSFPAIFIGLFLISIIIYRLNEQKYVTTEFDARCISPGTEFMANFEATLADFVKSKMKFDRLWQKCGVVINASSVSKLPFQCIKSALILFVDGFIHSVLERVR